MRWNRIRRRLTRELDTQISDWREEVLDKLLSGSWEKFSAALVRGEVLELEASYETWVANALNEHLPQAALTPGS